MNQNETEEEENFKGLDNVVAAVLVPVHILALIALGLFANLLCGLLCVYIMYVWRGFFV